MLLVGGTTTTPGDVTAVQKKQKNGKKGDDNYLAGLDYDLAHVKGYGESYGCKYFNSLRDCRGLTRQKVLDNVQQLMESCKSSDHLAWIYYTGINKIYSLHRSNNVNT